MKTATSSQRTAKLVLGAALVSGCATLIYELAWIRVLTLAVGATYPAITVVLAGMMLGLGLGSLAGGAVADRTRNPLKVYAVVEICVLVVAAMFPFVAEAVASTNLGKLGVLSGRALLAGALMLPATIGMGMTFPLLSTALHRDDDGAAHVPALYSANTLGATAGTLFGGLVLPFAIGVTATLAIAAGLNLLAAVIAWTASKGVLPRQDAVAVPPSSTGYEDKQGLLLALAFGSGALVLLAELFWTRSLTQLHRDAFDGLAVESADMMALVMVLVLLGNGLGGLIAARFSRWTPRELARALFISWTVGGLLGLLILEWFGVRIGAERGISAWRWYHLVLRMLPVAFPSVLLGLSFPLLARLYAGALAGHGRRMGHVWLANTVGSVSATIVGGWLLIPSIGTGWGLILTAVLACGLGYAALLLGDLRTRWGTIGALAIIALVAIAVPLGPGQYYRYAMDGVVLDSWEGWEATTVVVKLPDMEIISSNGRWIPGDAGYSYGATRALGDIALFTGRPAREVMLVGFGTGLFAKGLLETPGLERLVIVEIDGGQLRATDHFQTSSILSDPRVTIVVNDALHYLATTKRRFDAILVDSWGPEASPAIYSLQFHQRALSRLNEGGVVWAKLRGDAPLDEASKRAVYDAASCAYPIAAIEMGLGTRVIALVGLMEQPVGPNNMVALDACTAASEPLELLHPRRLHATAAMMNPRR